LNRYCGIDWAESPHDIAIIDQDGTLVSKKRHGDDPTGFATLTQLLTDAGDRPDSPIPVAIETPRGLMFSLLLFVAVMAGSAPLWPTASRIVQIVSVTCLHA
jgi:hypothetical protein